MKRKRWGTKHEDKRDWKQYNETLVQRGEFYLNPRFLDTWLKEIKEMNQGKIGQPYIYPNSLIVFLSVLWSKGFDLRALQGIVRVLSRKLGPFPVISFSQIRRRILNLPMTFRKRSQSLVASCDGSGMKAGNRGEWIRQKWKVQRGWIKVVIMGNTDGDIVDIRIGNEELDERRAARGMIRKNQGQIEKMLLDGWHDCHETFDLCDRLGIEPGIKIRKNAKVTGVGPRPREVRRFKKLGYKMWAKEKGYGYRWPASEGIFSAVKRMFGEGVRSHRTRNMYHEAGLKFWVYQQIRDGK